MEALDWLRLAYGGDVTGSLDRAQPDLAARLLQATPDLAGDDPYIACAAGDERTLDLAIAADAAWVDRAGGPLALPPLVAVVHSQLWQLPAFREKLRRAARRLLAAGADPNQSFGNRFPPASLAAPDESARLSALYGAAGVNRDPVLTELLLAAGADPNDGESLYHSLENPACTRLLLQHGARVAGTNALWRALDMREPDTLALLLSHGGDANERATGPIGAFWRTPLLRAIAVRRSAGHVAALLAAGADPAACTADGISAYRLAQQTGATGIAALLQQAGVAEELSETERFVAACARADAAEARRIRSDCPEVVADLAPSQLRLMPDTLAWGSAAAARVMVELGWPVAARGGDWDATALNLAVFGGNAALAAWLLAHGADWRERHGHGDDVIGTLSWASLNRPVAGGDWAACARALLAHGLPRAGRDPASPARLLIDGRSARFSTAVEAALLA